MNSNRKLGMCLMVCAAILNLQCKDIPRTKTGGSPNGSNGYTETERPGRNKSGAVTYYTTPSSPPSTASVPEISETPTFGDTKTMQNELSSGTLTTVVTTDNPKSSSTFTTSIPTTSNNSRPETTPASTLSSSITDTMTETVSVGYTAGTAMISTHILHTDEPSGILDALKQWPPSNKITVSVAAVCLVFLIVVITVVCRKTKYMTEKGKNETVSKMKTNVRLSQYYTHEDISHGSQAPENNKDTEIVEMVDNDLYEASSLGTGEDTVNKEWVGTSTGELEDCETKSSFCRMVDNDLYCSSDVTKDIVMVDNDLYAEY